MKLTLETLRMYCTEAGDCLYWNLGVNNKGYPQACLDGKPGKMVRRYVMHTLMEKPVDRTVRVVARCGSPLCVSPKCLYRTSFSAVMKRSYSTGMRSREAEYRTRLSIAKGNGWVKLTEDQAHQIRAMDASLSNAAVGRLFGVGGTAVSKIRRGVSWRIKPRASSVFEWRP